MVEGSRKRPRERPTTDAEMFAIYEDLANEDELIRRKAAKKLCLRVQSTEVNELETVLKRLIKGLCSSRKAARLGFSMTLTEILYQQVGHNELIPASRVLALLEELSQPPGDALGQEARDYYIGQVFAAHAIIRSNILFIDNDGHDRLWEQLLSNIFTLSKKKPWLREECGWVAYQALEQLSQMPRAADRASMLMHALAANSIVKTPEGVALWLAMTRLFPTAVLPSNVFARDDPLATVNRKLLVRIMREDNSKADAESEESQAQGGSWSSAPHFAWELLFQRIKQAKSADEFALYWRELVDEGLFAASSSHERKRSGFGLFASMVEVADAEHVPFLLSKNIVVNLNQQLSTKSKYLHQAATEAVENLLGRVQKSPQITPKLLEHLLADRAIIRVALNPNLRAILTDKLVACTDVSSVGAVVDAMIKALNLGKPATDNSGLESTNASLAWVITRIRSLPYPQAGSAELDAVRVTYCELLRSLARLAFFIKDGPDPEISASNVEHGKRGAGDSFYSTQLNNALANLLIKDPDPTYYQIITAKTLSKLQASSDVPNFLDSQVQKQVDKAQKKLAKLSKAGTQHEQLERPLALLFAVCIIQVYNADADALDALEDLQGCYESIKAQDSEEEVAKAADAIVEILLAFTSKPATMLKNLAQKAFALCTDTVTANGLDSMIAVLQSQEDISGQDEMFDQRDDDISDEDIDGMEDSDVEMLDADEGDDASASKSTDGDSKDEDDESSESTSSASEAEEEPSEDEEDAELMAFDTKLAEALGTRRADADIAHDDEESSESDMDDDQMEQLDEHLALMFKQRKQAENKTKKKEKKEAKETVVIFKTRVLELLRIYISKQHSNPLALRLVSPLVQLVRDTGNSKVRTEALELLNMFFKRVKLVNKDGKLDKAIRKDARRLLGGVHEMLCAKRSKPLQSACSRASLLLTKVYLCNGGKPEEVITQYQKTAERVANKPDKFKAEFFKNWDDWFISAKKDLA